MPAFLAKRLSLAKWSSQKNIRNGSVASDGVTVDLRTSDNILSFWTYDAVKGASLEEIVIALAATRDSIQRLELAWLQQKRVRRIGLRVDEVEGETPAKTLKHRHRDIVGIDLDRLVRLARLVDEAIKKKQVKVFTEKEVLKLLSDAVKNKILDPADLKTSVAAKITTYLSANP